MDEDWVQATYGVKVFFRRWRAENPRAAVVVVHGASEHSGRYDRVATALNGAGLSVYAPDHRGHGLTAASTGKGRVGAGGGSALIEDVDLLVDAATSENPGVPLAVFGHSMGSLIALAYATEHPERLRSLVLSGFPAPMAALDATRQMFQSAVDAGLADEAMPSLAGMGQGPDARTPYDWLSRDVVEVDRYIADPMCGDDNPLTYGFINELNAIVTPALEPAALARIRCPVLLVTGEADPAAAHGDNPRLLEKLLDENGVNVDHRLYPEARHELLNETNRDEVTGDVIAWISRQLDG